MPQTRGSLLPVCCVAALLLSGCTTKPVADSPDRYRREARAAMVRSCLRTPDRYGFSYTREQINDLSMHAPDIVDSVFGHCATVARVATP